jgi:hypothetical protein
LNVPDLQLPLAHPENTEQPAAALGRHDDEGTVVSRVRFFVRPFLRTEISIKPRELLLLFTVSNALFPQ